MKNSQVRADLIAGHNLLNRIFWHVCLDNEDAKQIVVACKDIIVRDMSVTELLLAQDISRATNLALWVA